MTKRNILFVPGIICIIMILASCGPKAMAPKAELDTPVHHVNNGNKLLESGKIMDASREFARAVELDPKYSPAYVGSGLVSGMKKDYASGFEMMKKANGYAMGKAQKLNVHIGYMRLYIMGKEPVDKNWLSRVENRFSQAVKIDQQMPEPYFYMGMAYKNAFDFKKAASQFSKVLDINKRLIHKADREYAIIQKIQRAMPGSSVGKKISLLDRITRADIAALFIEELSVDKIYRKKTLKKFDTGFKSPDSYSIITRNNNLPQATDIKNHVLKADMDAVIAAGIHGLLPYPDHTFKPDKIITRAEFVMMIEDILIKITGDNALATKFIGSPSPFPDVRNDLPYFNAAMVCTTRNILQTGKLATGEFDPMGPVSGAEALLSIRMLKSQL